MWVEIYLPVILVFIASGLVVHLSGKVRDLEDQLMVVRLASYELHTTAQDNIADLTESLIDHGIPLSHKHTEERMRRKAMTTAEAKAEFDKVCDEALALSRKLREERHG